MKTKKQQNRKTKKEKKNKIERKLDFFSWNFF